MVESTEEKAFEDAPSGKGKFGEKIDELGQKVQVKAKDMIEGLTEKAQEKAKDLKEGLTREVASLKKKNLDAIADDVRGYVVDNPGRSVSFALLAGFIVGVLFKRR